jgi:hypothetical protein
MTKYVIGPDVAILLAHNQAVIRDEHQILAPTLLRSQMLSLLYQAVHRGEMTKKDADQQLNYVRGLRIRLLGDRVLQNVAWKIADQLGWSDTFDAEYGCREGSGDSRTCGGAVLVEPRTTPPPQRTPMPRGQRPRGCA